MAQLTPEEEAFIIYWEANRKKQRTLTNQLLVGLPLGILFGVPVILNLLSGWYKRANMEANAELSPAVLLIAVLLIVVFVAIFSRKHKWERREQMYRELIARKELNELQQ